ncbi:hypothetical protein ABK040_011990 [Willaertia magna]
MSSNQIYKNILVYEANPKVLVIQLNREHVKNAVDKETADELYNAFTVDFEKNNDYSVAILYGGENTFCSGADLKNISKGALNLVEPPSETNIGPMGPTRLELSKPVIAAIGSGYAVAGGMELACFCDLRVCKEDSKFGIFCRRFGVPLIDGGTIRLPALIGLSRAMDLILTGREISGEEAFSIGFVNRLIKSDENVLQKAIELANQLAQFPQDCMRNDRLSTLKYIYNNLNEHLQNEYLFGMKSLQSEEFQKGNSKRIKMTAVLKTSIKSINQLFQSVQDLFKFICKLQIHWFDKLCLMYFGMVAILGYCWGQIKRETTIKAANPEINYEKKTFTMVKKIARLFVKSNLQVPKAVIVVNDGSKSFSLPNIGLSEFEFDLYLIDCKENNGPTSARNIGIREAKIIKGETDIKCICFTDLDCVPGKEWVEEHLFMNSNNKPSIASGLTVSLGNTYVDMYHNYLGTLNGRKFKQLNTLVYGPTCNLSFSSELLDKLQFDNSFPNASFEDIDFCVTAFEVYEIKTIFAEKAVVRHDFNVSPYNFIENTLNQFKQFKRYGGSEFKMLEKHGIICAPQKQLALRINHFP